MVRLAVLPLRKVRPLLVLMAAMAYRSLVYSAEPEAPPEVATCACDGDPRDNQSVQTLFQQIWVGQLTNTLLICLTRSYEPK